MCVPCLNELLLLVLVRWFCGDEANECIARKRGGRESEVSVKDKGENAR